MAMPFMLLQAVLLPLLSMPLIAILGRRIGRRVAWVSGAILAYTNLLLASAMFSLWSGAAPIVEEYAWTNALFTLEFGFSADGLSLPVAMIVNLVCNALVIFSIEYLDHRVHAIYNRGSNSLNAFYYSLFMLFSTGLLGISFATNLIEVYIFLDFLLIPLYFIMDHFGYVTRHRVATMCFLWGFIAGALFLLGSVLAYSQTGSFMISDLPALVGTPMAFWAAFLMLLGILVKLAVFGFHVWLPWVHAEHPSCIAGVLAVIVGIENYLIARIFIQQIPSIFELFSVPLMAWALVTMVYGAYLTLAQDDVKRLYACSTIGQTAYSLLGLASCTAFGAAGGIFYFLSHSLGKAILFSVAGIVVYRTGTRDMRQMGGLAKRMPMTAALCIMGSMVLSAMPPLSGFPSEWIMFVGIFQQGVQGSVANLAIALVGIFATFLTPVYTFWPAMRIFFGPLQPYHENVREAPLTMLVPLLVLAAVSLLIGIYPEIITRLLLPAFTGVP